MTIRFDDKVAIVTGAGGGIGKEHALELARRGAKVVVNDLGGTVDGSGASDAANEVVDLIKMLKHFFSKVNHHDTLVVASLDSLTLPLHQMVLLGHH